jgi:hypothetical protein
LHQHIHLVPGAGEPLNFQLEAVKGLSMVFMGKYGQRQQLAL